jgi:hypothetical protein
MVDLASHGLFELGRAQGSGGVTKLATRGEGVEIRGGEMNVRCEVLPRRSAALVTSRS